MTDEELRAHFARVVDFMGQGFARLADAQARTEAQVARIGEQVTRTGEQVARVGEHVSALTAVILNRLVPANERTALAVEALTRRIDALIRRRGDGGGPEETA